MNERFLRPSRRGSRTKHLLVTDGLGLPLEMMITAGQEYDAKHNEVVLDVARVGRRRCAVKARSSGSESVA